MEKTVDKTADDKKPDLPAVIVEKTGNNSMGSNMSRAGDPSPTQDSIDEDQRKVEIRSPLRDSVWTLVKFVRRSSAISYNVDKFTMVTFQRKYSSISPFYLFYKYCHALAMLSFLALNISHLAENETELKWHLYMNHWSSIICSAEAIGGVFVVNYYYHQCRTKAMRDTLRMTDSMVARLIIYTYLNATAVTFSATASIMFWAFIYEDDFYTFVRIIEHAAIPAFMVLKLFIENIPFEFSFGFYPLSVLLFYFIDVITYYFLLFRESFLKGKIKIYIFKYFNDQSLIFFIWFTIEACLILAGVHVILVLFSIFKNLLQQQLCVKRTAIAEFSSSKTPEMSPTRTTVLVVLKEAELTKKYSPPNRLVYAYWIVKNLERSNRHDFIQSEWVHRSSDQPTAFYLLYRFIHMQLFIVMTFFSFAEPDRPNDSQSVKYFLLWIFYFGNFFMCISLFQSIFGFAIIFKSYRQNKDELKYFQKSERYVTGVQRTYAAVNSTATTLALFTLASAWQLVEDTGGSFDTLDYRYDSSHLINPLAMALDFILVGHPFKTAHFLLTMCFFVMNIVFNYWLYSSKITSRTGKKFIYEYLNWDKPNETFIHIAILFGMVVSIHLFLWALFLLKRCFSIATKKRRHGELQKYRMLRELSLGSVQFLTVPPSRDQIQFLKPGNLQDSSRLPNPSSNSQTPTNSNSSGKAPVMRASEVKNPDNRTGVSGNSKTVKKEEPPPPVQATIVSESKKSTAGSTATKSRVSAGSNSPKVNRQKVDTVATSSNVKKP